MARAKHGLAVLLKKLNSFKESERTFREALALRQALVASAPADLAAKEALAETRFQFGSLLANLNQSLFSSSGRNVIWIPDHSTLIL